MGFSRAYGGRGGYGLGGSNGGAGGQAYALLALTGSNAVNATTEADSGVGGKIESGAGTAGPGGAARAVSVGKGSGLVEVTAVARAMGSGDASAKAKALGTGGAFVAMGVATLSPGGLIKSDSALAQGQVGAKTKAKVGVDLGQAFSTANFAFSAGVALQDAAPAQASGDAILAANSNISAAFGASPVYFSLGDMGGAYSAGGATTQTATDTLDLSVDLTQLAIRGDLILGLFDPTIEGTGFSSLTFTLTADGSIVENQTFTTVAAAEAFFTNDAIDLGSLASGPLSGNTLTLQATLAVSFTTAGQGVYFGLITGDPPPASTALAGFVHARAGLTARPAGAPTMIAGHSSPTMPVLTAPRFAIA